MGPIEGDSIEFICIKSEHEMQNKNIYIYKILRIALR